MLPPEESIIEYGMTNICIDVVYIDMSHTEIGL